VEARIEPQTTDEVAEQPNEVAIDEDARIAT